MEKGYLILLLATICETIWETLKTARNSATGKVEIDRIGAMGVGLLMAFGTGLNAFDAIGIEIVFPWLGTALTGLLLSRGANFIHDLLGRIEKLKP